MRLTDGTKCVICGKDLPVNMTQLLLDLKGNSACLQHEGTEELYEWIIRHQKHTIETLQLAKHNEGARCGNCEKVTGKGE